MASNYRKYIIQLPISLNDTDDDSLITNRQASYVRNIDFKADGFGIRKGYTKSNSTDFGANEITSMLEYQYSGSNSLLVVSNNVLKREVDTNTFTDIGSVSSGILEGVNVNYSFDTNPANDKLLFLDGTDYRYYDGTAISSVPAYTPTTEELANPGLNILKDYPDEIKKANFLQLYQNRVWTLKGKVLRWSDVKTMGGHFANYFPAIFEMNFPNDGTAFIIYDKPIVFTDKSIHVVMGSTALSSDFDRYRYVDIPTEAGCSAHRTVKVTNMGVFFLHRKGVFRLEFDGSTYRVTKISEGEGIQSKSKIQKFIDSKTDQQIKDAFAVVGDDKYILKFSDGTAAVFNLIERGWTVYDNLPGKCGIVINDKILFGGQYVYKMLDGLNDDGAAIQTAIEGKNSNLDLPTQIKEFDTWTISVRSDLRSYTLYPGYAMDFINITDVKPIVCRMSRWGEMRFGDRIRTTDVTLNRPLQLKKGDDKYSFKWKLSSNGLNEQWQVISMFLDYKAKELS